MQLMHIEYCLYASSCSGVWAYSVVSGSSSPSLISHGWTWVSLPRKSSISTTRSLMTGKPLSGSILIGPSLNSVKNVPQVSRGLPSTFMPHEPQMPIRHDQRNDSDPSSWSLM